MIQTDLATRLLVLTPGDLTQMREIAEHCDEAIELSEAPDQEFVHLASIYLRQAATALEALVAERAARERAEAALRSAETILDGKNYRAAVRALAVIRAALIPSQKDETP